MLTDEALKICLLRVPYCTFFGTFVASLGIVLLFHFKNEMEEAATSITVKFYEIKSSSFKRGIKWFLYLSFAFICLTALVITMGFMSNSDFRARLFRTSKARVIGMALCVIMTKAAKKCINGTLFIKKRKKSIDLKISPRTSPMRELILLTLALICFWFRHSEFYSSYYYYIIFTQVECDLFDERGAGSSCVGQTIGNLLIDEKEIIYKDVCGDQREPLCTYYLSNFRKQFVKVFSSFCLIVLGLVIYCMCLSADFIKIRCQAKFQELEDLRSLEIDLSSKGAM